MRINVKLVNGLLLLSGLYCSMTLAGSAELTKINFYNLALQTVQQTQVPYADNFSYYSSDSNYKFSAPAAISVMGSEQASVSYDWWYNWFNVTQYAYNYPGRSTDYGCFVTEIGLSWEFKTYRIVIASYRKDPSYPADYIICTAEKTGSNEFTVIFNSSLLKKDEHSDDSQRYNIAGDAGELAHTTFFGIDKPIPLNPNFSQPKLVLEPDHKTPTEPASSPTADVHAANRIDEITVINNSSVPIVAGTPLLDKFSRLSSQYFIEQPSAIAPKETVKIRIGNPDIPRDFDLERFNYHIEHYDLNSGCFITSSKRWVTSPVTSFYFDPQHPEKNIYCLVTSTNTVEIDDDPELVELKRHGCNESDLKNCVSTQRNFYKDGDTLKGLNFKYRILPLAPDAAKHYLKVSPGDMDPTIYYLPPGPA